MLGTLHISHYDYLLPEDRIALYPLPERDDSRLLFYNRGDIRDQYFKDLPFLIPSGSKIVFNNSRVVPARLLFVKASGALIEVLCLEPVEPNDYVLSFNATESVVWRVVIGNRKRWKEGSLFLYNPLNQQSITSISLSAECVGKDGDIFMVRFHWRGGMTFSEVLLLCGEVPIPPYLRRRSEFVDIERYQTIYACLNGSVAAPTAGLHFTKNIITSLQSNNISLSEITLHVGAGTFLPVKTDIVAQHQMHSELFVVSLSFLEELLSHKGAIVGVGTTSVRCLESLYYLGLMCRQGLEPNFLSQWDAYSFSPVLSRKESLECLIAYLRKKQLTDFYARTQIMIVPSFTFRWTDGLITNFHQPKSTLLLLIAAFIGEDWRRCYVHALRQGYRFLSYGDSSLLWPQEERLQSY